jgi:uncharacterized protein (DUF362 family)
MVTTVSLARESSYDDPARVRAAIMASLAPLGGIGAFVPAGSRVLLKPNLVRVLDPERGGLTHPVFVAEVARLAFEAGAREVLVGDSPGIGTANGVAARAGLTPMLDALGARLVEFTEATRVPSPRNGTFGFLSQSGEALTADVLINLPKAKAHCQMVLTGAVKNLFGCIPGRRKALMHCLVKNDRARFARMLVENALMMNPAVTIMDGIVAMEGQGPTSGDPRPWGWVLAGTDMVALDAVMARALGYGHAEVPHLVAASALGAGQWDCDRIALAGARWDELAPASWKRARLMPVSFNPLRLALGYLKNWRAWRAVPQGAS